MADPALRVLSLFSGIGGLDLGVACGLERVGVPARHVGYVEREAFGAACLVAAMERGDLAPAPVFVGDVERFRPPAADLVLAGFPCPPVSCAGKRLGTADARWLWPEVVRVVRDSGASLVFLENVRGLLTANDGAAFGEVLGDLARLGFDAEWAVLAASDVGAPHRRERVFVLAWRPDDMADRDGEGRGELDGGAGAGRDGSPRRHADRRDPAMEHAADERYERSRGAWSRGAGPSDDGWNLGDGDDAARSAAPSAERLVEWQLAVAQCKGLEGYDERQAAWRRAPGPSGGGWPCEWPPVPGERDRWLGILAADPGLAPAVVADVRRVADGASAPLDGPVGRVDRLRALGNAVVPAQAEAAFVELWRRIGDAGR